MKVLLIHQAFVSPEEAGGTRHYEFARHCAQHGIEFTIVASNLSYLTGKPVAEPRAVVFREDVGEVKVLRARTIAALHRSFVWRVVSFLSFMVTSTWAGLRAGPMDLVIGTTPSIFQAFSAWLVAALRRKPFLLEVRDLWPEFAIDMGVLKNPILIAMSRRLERFLYWRADHLLVNSPAYRDYLVEKKGISPSKVTLIPNGADTDMFQPEERGESFRSEQGLNGKFVVTYAGAIGLANDIPTVLHAAKRLKDEQNIHFLFVGDGKERLRMEEMAVQLGLNNVSFTGPRPKSRMPEVMAASDVCVATLQDIPMFRMPYPNKVFDYMAAGRPTLLAIDGVIRDVLEASNGGLFVSPGSSVALAEGIQTLRRQPELGRQMGLAARSYVKRHFNRRDQAEAFRKLLQRVIA
jgi:glycosyltransferase involved in cell wall biosynthesis